MRRMRPGDGPALRALRLRALGETPEAFRETYEAALAGDDASWEARVARSCAPGHQVAVVAEEDSGTWVGMMGAFVGEEHDRSGAVLPSPPVPVTARWAMVWGVYVAPENRGSGLAAELFGAVRAWASDEAGVDWLGLEVGQNNHRARAFYRRQGFLTATPRNSSPLEPSCELVMVLPLRGAAAEAWPGRRGGRGTCTGRDQEWAMSTKRE